MFAIKFAHIMDTRLNSLFDSHSLSGVGDDARVTVSASVSYVGQASWPVLCVKCPDSRDGKDSRLALRNDRPGGLSYMVYPRRFK
jgi:hypothetical protein